ncbi:hypothetical protein PTSG_07489 [Salpingoeca rosetta]|uniref:Cytochrome b5 heme-binding domain-containing protein n=1 Tax=Salpingoeca rosetta (strain ATCC 50818 / BSB-021) TaxID=946362 RepID=F2UIV7_SALR5|nr:uncharacterized protein PTSG_07489 [Salpingoeca rosetta]EGD77156.1 hypothetical protein PTSG_07489 [Salpingoeca rosetta]|eukprot:XP_004990995.1 hypothetical protein PTSG_07489 [Salpingoeca rosetta]
MSSVFDDEESNDCALQPCENCDCLLSRQHHHSHPRPETGHALAAKLDNALHLSVAQRINGGSSSNPTVPASPAKRCHSCPSGICSGCNPVSSANTNAAMPPDTSAHLRQSLTMAATAATKPATPVPLAAYVPAPSDSASSPASTAASTAAASSSSSSSARPRRRSSRNTSTSSAHGDSSYSIGVDVGAVFRDPMCDACPDCDDVCGLPSCDACTLKAKHVEKRACSRRGRGCQKNVFTMCQVQRHNSASDCWLVAHRKVYDVTAFVRNDFHRAGMQAIIRKGGTDVTRDFDFHSSKSKKQLWSKYLIGVVAKCPSEAPHVPKKGGSKASTLKKLFHLAW